MQIVKVRDLQDERYDLVQNSQDIDHIAELEADERIAEYGSLLVAICDGELDEIWGTHSVPYLEYNGYKLK
jgi:hypothetical protein